MMNSVYPQVIHRLKLWIDIYPSHLATQARHRRDAERRDHEAHHQSTRSALFQVARLRYRAEEARVIAEDMQHWDIREMMFRIAEEYEDLADSLERPTHTLQ